jgi:hypothetical protein
MKSDGTDQMNTVAKTAEYPFDRLGLWRHAVSLRLRDVLWFIIKPESGMLNRSVRCPQRIAHVCGAQGSTPLRQATLQHGR